LPKEFDGIERQRINQRRLRMHAMLTNWKTTSAGALMIIIGVAGVFGVHIAGFSMEPGAAIAAGIGLLVAKDAAI
jgi:hypothetical protein